MYNIYIEQLSGLKFVEDETIVTTKLAILNKNMAERGYLDANEFYEAFKLEPQYPDIKFTTIKGMMFMFRPSNIWYVPVVTIGIEKVDY